MAMKHAVLGLLVQRSGTAAELAHRFRHRVGEAWALSPSHIYKALDQLQSERLVALRPTKGERRRYVATDAGRREFERWLRGPVRLQPLREELYLRISFCPPRHLDSLLDVISVQERVTYEALEELSAKRALEDALRPPIDWGRAATQLIVAGQIARFETDLAWLRDTRKTVQWLRTQPLVVRGRSVSIDDEQATG
jgi:DNA-binding PadR family transcriptional regulator